MRLRREGSIEGETKKALRRLTVWRIVTAFFGVWEDVWTGLARLPQAIAGFARECAKAAYSVEQEHARRYFALTQLDPARADGDDDRYREIRIAAGVEEREDDSPDLFAGDED